MKQQQLQQEKEALKASLTKKKTIQYAPESEEEEEENAPPVIAAPMAQVQFKVINYNQQGYGETPTMKQNEQNTINIGMMN